MALELVEHMLLVVERIQLVEWEHTMLVENILLVVL